MIPEIFSIGPLPINSFGLCVALSFIACIYLLADSFEKNGLPPERAESYILTAGFLGLIGARVLYLIEHWSEIQSDILGAVFSSAGFTFYGGFIVSFIALLIMAKRDGFKIPSFMDSMGPTLALGYAIGRLGCQLSGDGDYGMSNAGFWAMSYAQGVVPTPPGILVYPTPLFESTASILILWILLQIQKYELFSKPYRQFSVYLMLISIERFSVEFIRINPRLLFDLSEAQLVASGFFCLGFLLFLFSGLSKNQSLKKAT